MIYATSNWIYQFKSLKVSGRHLNVIPLKLDISFNQCIISFCEIRYEIVIGFDEIFAEYVIYRSLYMHVCVGRPQRYILAYDSVTDTLQDRLTEAPESVTKSRLIWVKSIDT